MRFELTRITEEIKIVQFCSCRKSIDSCEIRTHEGCPNNLAGYRLNHSAKLSYMSTILMQPTHIYNIITPYTKPYKHIHHYMYTYTTILLHIQYSSIPQHAITFITITSYTTRHIHRYTTCIERASCVLCIASNAKN